MALSDSRLRDAIITAYKARNPNIDATEQTRLEEFIGDLCAEIVTEFTSNAVVNSTGIDPPGDSGGTVVSTGTIT